MTDYGQDVSTFPDLDPGFAAPTGPRVVAESIARRLTTPRGALFWAPDDGFDVRELLNESVTSAKLSQWTRALEQECEKDERVLSASITLTYDSTGMALQIAASLDTADGPFVLVMVVTSVQLTILDAR